MWCSRPRCRHSLAVQTLLHTMINKGLYLQTNHPLTWTTFTIATIHDTTNIQENSLVSCHYRRTQSWGRLPGWDKHHVTTNLRTCTYIFRCIVFLSDTYNLYCCSNDLGSDVQWRSFEQGVTNLLALSHWAFFKGADAGTIPLLLGGGGGDPL